MQNFIVELIRLETSMQGTFGTLRINKRIFCTTLEPYDRFNQRNVSCIPAQQYICDPFHSQKFGKTYEVQNVPGRSFILFHSGNVVEHTEGCIILGQTKAKLESEKRALINSGGTFEEFKNIIGQQSFHLTIKEVY